MGWLFAYFAYYINFKINQQVLLLFKEVNKHTKAMRKTANFYRFFQVVCSSGFGAFCRHPKCANLKKSKQIPISYANLLSKKDR